MVRTDASQIHDLIIIGASFAGLVAARTAAMRGLRVVVLDAKPDAGHRVATTGILVKEAAEEVDLPHKLTRRVHGVRLYGPDLNPIDLFAPGYFFLTTDTAELLRWLADEACRAGAEIRYGLRFEGAERCGSLIRLPALGLTGRYLLGADGGRSAVARHFGLGRNSRFLVGVEAEYEGLELDHRFLHCFLDSRIAPGYLGWIASGPKVAQVGLAVSHGRRPSLDAFRTHTAGIFDYRQARLVERRAGRIPSGGMVSPLGAPGVMLVGDAAGMVSPMTGGGIRLAFHFGRRSAQAIADHLLHLGPPPHRVLAAELPGFALKGLMRRAMDLAPPNWVLQTALGTSPMRLLAQHVYFHRRGAAGVSLAEFEAKLAELKVPLAEQERGPATSA